MSTAVTWLCCARRVAIDIPTYPVPATAMLYFLPMGFLESLITTDSSVKRSVTSKPRTSPRLCSCSIDGIYSPFSRRPIMERLMPVRLLKSACVSLSAFLLLITVLIIAWDDNFFISAILSLMNYLILLDFNSYMLSDVYQCYHLYHCYMPFDVPILSHAIN